MANGLSYDRVPVVALKLIEIAGFDDTDLISGSWDPDGMVAVSLFLAIPLEGLFPFEHVKPQANACLSEGPQVLDLKLNL